MVGREEGGVPITSLFPSPSLILLSLPSLCLPYRPLTHSFPFPSHPSPFSSTPSPSSTSQPSPLLAPFPLFSYLFSPPCVPLSSNSLHAPCYLYIAEVSSLNIYIVFMNLRVSFKNAAHSSTYSTSIP